MLRFKVDIIEELRDRGITSYYAKVNGILSQGTFEKMRRGVVPVVSIDALCSLLNMQPGDLIEWIPDPEKSPEEKSPEK